MSKNVLLQLLFIVSRLKKGATVMTSVGDLKVSVGSF